MPSGPRKLRKIHIVLDKDVLFHGTTVNMTRLERLEFFQFVFPISDRFGVAEIFCDAIDQTFSGFMREKVSQDPEALLISPNRIEEHRRRIRPGSCHFRDRADLQTETGALDNRELPEVFVRGEVVPEVGENLILASVSSPCTMFILSPTLY